MSTLYPVQTPISNGITLPANAPVATYNRTALATVPGNTINVYVDGVSGDDANDGFAAVQGAGNSGPIKTVGAIYEKVPSRPFAGCKVIVNFIGPSTGAPQLYNDLRAIYMDGGENLMYPFRFRGGFISAGVFVAGMIPYVPTTGPATAALDVVPAVAVSLNNASGVATPLRTRLDFTVAAPGWTVNDFAARGFVRISRAGVMRYWEIPISGNTADTLFIDTLGIVGDILATDTVEIVRPAVDWRGPSNADTNNVATLAVLGGGINPLNNISLFGKDGGAMFERITFGGVMVTRGSFTASFDRCACAAGNSVYAAESIAFVNCALQRGGINIIANRFSRFVGQSRPDSPTVPTLQAATSPAVSVAGFNTTIQLGVNGNNANEIIYLGQGTLVFSYPVGMWSSRPRLAGETRLGSGISLAGPASSLIMNNGIALIGDTDTVFVTAGTLPAIRARVGAQVRIDPAVTSITGKGGVDVQVETGPAVAYGTGAGQFMEANGINGNFLRSSAAVVKKSITQAAADAIADITLATGGGPPVKSLLALNVTAGVAGFLGTYILAPSGSTTITAGGNLAVGVATISDDGKTITFPAGTQATAVTIEYIPRIDTGDSSRIFTSFPA